MCRRARSSRRRCGTSEGSSCAPAGTRTRRRSRRPGPPARGRPPDATGTAVPRAARGRAERGRASPEPRREARGAAVRAPSLLQLLAQLLERPAQARLDRTAADAERRRGLGFREIEQVAANDGIAVVIGETL